MYKKILGIVTALSVALTLQTAHAAESVLLTVIKEGVLRVGVTGDWNPMSMKNPADNSYTGFDVDVTTELAKDLGVKVEFVPTDWKTLVTGVTSGKYHITGSASINPKRAKVAGFSASYVEVGQLPLILKKNANKFSSWDDFNKAGVTVAATLGTTQEQYIKTFFPNATHRIVESPARDYQDVLAGRADMHITSNIEAKKLIEKHDNMMIVDVGEAKARTPLAMLVPQADQVWINYVDHWIAVKKARGFFEELKDKWKL